MGVVWLDTETTGLDPDRHEIWELAFARWAKRMYEAVCAWEEQA